MKKSSLPLFVLFFLLPIVSFAGVRLSSVGLQVGQVLPSVTNLRATSIGAHCFVQQDDSDLLFQPFFDYWAVSYDKNSTHWNRRLFAVGMSALKPFNLNNSKAVPFMGGGLGVTLLSWQTKSDHDPEQPSKDFEFDLALNVVGGITVPVTSALHGLIQLKYTLAGVVDYFGFWAGLSYHFNANSIQQD